MVVLFTAIAASSTARSPLRSADSGQVERNQAKYFIAANNNLVWGNIRVSRNDAGEDISAWQNKVQGSIHYESNTSRDDVLPQFFNSVLLNNVGQKVIIQKNHVGCFPGHIGSASTHGNAYICLF